MVLRFACQYCHEGGFQLDADFGAGDGVTAICGPSGSGKTTILLLIAGLLHPREGRITVGDTVLVDTAQRVWVPPHRRSIGVVFQDSLLFPHRTVRANLTFGLRWHSNRQLTLERVAKVLELGDLMDRLPGTLSGGQARRVAIGRALLCGPRLLILDEPWAGLDDELRERVTWFLEQCLAEWRIPMILVSHDRASVERLADTVITIRDGRVAPDAARSPGSWSAVGPCCMRARVPEAAMPPLEIPTACAPGGPALRLPLGGMDT